MSLDSTYLSHRNSLNKRYRVDHLEVLVLKTRFRLSFLSVFTLLFFFAHLSTPYSLTCVCGHKRTHIQGLSPRRGNGPRSPPSGLAGPGSSQPWKHAQGVWGEFLDGSC